MTVYGKEVVYILFALEKEDISRFQWLPTKFLNQSR